MSTPPISYSETQVLPEKLVKLGLGDLEPLHHVDAQRRRIVAAILPRAIDEKLDHLCCGEERRWFKRWYPHLARICLCIGVHLGSIIISQATLQHRLEPIRGEAACSQFSLEFGDRRHHSQPSSRSPRARAQPWPGDARSLPPRGPARVCARVKSHIARVDLHLARCACTRSHLALAAAVGGSA